MLLVGRVGAPAAAVALVSGSIASEVMFKGYFN
jgi:hypothetical protein